METPICVADARTLVENVHDIKRWIYNGQLRLVVPSCIAEQVEQIYQKSKETKSVPKDTTRPKPFGKPAKIEYPPFDINPLLAKNFLARLKTWKEEDAASEQRIFFQEKENHGAVSLQQTSEQYTPWKDLEIEEEKPQVVEVRPTTWAEALRRKQNLANGIGENPRAPKGPVKPKLVAKVAGTDTSPWKIKRDAPKISAKDVPANLRPLMSCALWRLHESIDRNDSNELFLLSDESDIRTVAQKLNITVRSTKELRVLVAAKAKRPELDSFGDLERQFGVHARTDSKRTKGEGQHLNSEDDDLKRVKRLNDSISSDETAETEDSHVIDEPNSAELDQVVEGSSSDIAKIAKNDDERNPLEDPPLESTTSLVEDDASGEFTSRQGSSKSVDHSAPDMDGADDITARRSPEIVGLRTLEAMPDISGSSLPDEVTKPAMLPPDHIVTSAALPPASSAAMQTPAPSVPVEHESEDSDEDVVVFVPQPKRSSVQKKPTQQGSRPSTPLTQPQQQKLVDQSPRPSPPTASHQVKPLARGRNLLAVNHGHPQPTAAPTVIDPDSFGRSYAVNPNPSPRTLHNPRSHHRPRPSIENALFPQGPRGSPRQKSSRISPSSQSRTKSPRTSPAPELKDDTVGSQNSHAERTSPQKRSQALETRATGPRGRGSTHANLGTQLPIQRKTLNARMVESEEFVPRSAFTEAKLDPIGTPKATGDTKGQDIVTRIADSAVQIKPKAPKSPSVQADDFVPRSPMNAPAVRQQTPKPSVFEPNEFVPRNAMPASQYNQRMHEADANEPRAPMADVQYVLKSGSTRAATRGRGRLWIPS